MCIGMSVLLIPTVCVCMCVHGVTMDGEGVGEIS